MDATGFLEVPGTTTSLAHCCWLEEEEMQLLAKRRAVVVHNPAPRSPFLALFETQLPFTHPSYSLRIPPHTYSYSYR